MDAFFVACECLENPPLAGKPVVVGADPKDGSGRGVVSTCSYEARAFGIRSAMPISRAHQLCPDAIFLPVNGPLYGRTSQHVFALLAHYATKIEQTSIDEAFFIADIKDYEQAKALAERIKAAMKEQLNLTCSIGIGPNKSIAKIASDITKPDGLTIVKPEGAKSFLAPLPVRKLQGIGPKTEQLLNGVGIITVGQLASSDAKQLADLFGKWGPYLQALAQGRGDETLCDEQACRSVSRECTFEQDTSDRAMLDRTLDELTNELFAVVSGERLAFQCITIKVRYAGFETHTKQATLRAPTADKDVLVRTARELLSSFLGPKKIRLIGLRLSRFSSQRQESVKRFAR